MARGSDDAPYEFDPSSSLAGSHFVYGRSHVDNTLASAMLHPTRHAHSHSGNESEANRTEREENNAHTESETLSQHTDTRMNLRDAGMRRSSDSASGEEDALSQPARLIPRGRPSSDDHEHTGLLSPPVVKLHLSSSSPVTPPRRAASDSPAAPPNEWKQITEEERLIVSEADERVKAEHAQQSNSTSSSSSSSNPDDPEFLLRRWGTFESRLASFGSSDWPYTGLSHPHLSPSTLSAAGFFRHFGPVSSPCARDCVMCFACGVELEEFQPNDEPEESHRQARDETGVPCAFLQAIQQVRREQMRGDNQTTTASGNPELDLLLYDLASSSDSPRQPPSVDAYAAALDSSSSLDADSDGLPPLFTALYKTPSTLERNQAEIVETSEQSSRAIRATRGNAIRVDGLRVSKEAEVDAPSAIVTCQLRAPLQSFELSEGDSDTPCVYFQVLIKKLTNSMEDATSVHTIENAHTPPGVLTPVPSSASRPPALIIGIRCSPLHSGSGPPGSDAPSGSSGSQVGLTSDGDILLNGMGPSGGIVAMQNVPLYTDARRWQAGDVIGCMCDINSGIVIFHINGRQFGPALLQQRGTTNAAKEFYPTLSLTHAGDEIELQLQSSNTSFTPTTTTTSEFVSGGDAGSMMQSASSSSSSSFVDPLLRPVAPLDSNRIRTLYQLWSLPAPATLAASAIARLAQFKPDLGLVLDQTNVTTGGATPRKAGSMIAPNGTQALNSAQAPRQRLGSVVVSGPSTPLSPAPALPASPPGPVVISRILPGLSSDLAGLRVGDQIRRLNGRPIVVLKDAVTIVTTSTPGSILEVEVYRAGRRLYIPLTLGAKAMERDEFIAATRWAQWSRKCMEWVGPPFQGWNNLNTVSSTVALQPSSSSSSPSPPRYDPRAPKPLHGVDHIRALEIALVIERRLMQQIRTPLYLPEYKTIATRVETFEGQSQAWEGHLRQQSMTSGISTIASSNIASSSSPSSSSSSSSPLCVPPKPLNVALHGFLLAPVVGFPGRCVCFACGAIVSKITSIEGLIDEHRRTARENKRVQQSNTTTLITNEQPPAYRRAASLMPANLDAGCVFLTMYDSAVKHLREKQIALQRSTAARMTANATAQTAASGDSTLTPRLTSRDVAIDIEADDDGPIDAELMAAARNRSSSLSQTSTLGVASPRSRKELVGPIMSNTDNMARHVRTTQAAAAAAAATAASASVPSVPPPAYGSDASSPVVHCGAPIRVPFDPDTGIVWHSIHQSDPRSARVGEFTPGSVDLVGKLPLTTAEIRIRNKGRASVMQRGAYNAAAAGGGVGRGFDADGIHVIELAPLMNAPVRPPPPPPPPPRPPMEVLKEFFGGNPLFLLCKVPFFILILPFFLVYELIRGIWRCICSLCSALDRCCYRMCGACSSACHRCCDWLSDKCATCWNFLCCTILCDGICAPIFRAIRWACQKMNRYCCTPIVQCCKAIGNGIARCCTAMGNALTACCSWINRAICQPIGRCIAACCSAIGDACAAICNALTSCCTAICDGISRCCVWFWTPICDALAACASAIWRCISTICNAMWRAISWFCSGLYSCLASVCRAVSRCASWFCTCIGDCLSFLWRGITTVCRSIWRCIDYVLITPFVWMSKQVWRCCAFVVEWTIVKPAKGQQTTRNDTHAHARDKPRPDTCGAGGGVHVYTLSFRLSVICVCVCVCVLALWSCFCAVCSFVYAHLLVPVGQAISCVFSTLYSCVRSIGSALWSLLSSLASAIGSVLSAIYRGLFVPVGQAIASTGRAIKGLCA